MIKGEGFYKNPLRALRAWRFFISFGFDLFISALPVFSMRYHPRLHPACTTDKNILTVAWQAYEAAGFDVQHLNVDDISQMLVDQSIAN